MLLIINGMMIEKKRIFIKLLFFINKWQKYTSFFNYLSVLLSPQK